MCDVVILVSLQGFQFHTEYGREAHEWYFTLKKTDMHGTCMVQCDFDILVFRL